LPPERRNVWTEKNDGLMSRQLQPTLVKKTRIPTIGEETLKKLPHWKAWLYKTLKEIEEQSS